MKGLGPAILEELGSVVAARMGLHFPPARLEYLERAFCRAADDLGFRDPLACAQWFMTAPPSRELVEAISVYLTIGETYFFRESPCFSALEQKIVPALIRACRDGRGRLRFWSAGCATGEEAYSLAILLHRMGLPSRDLDVSILATDINPHALRKARDGIYSEWSFRSTPPRFRETYFRKTAAGRLELLPRIRNMVRFSYFNLVEDPCPSLVTETNAMDVIFCRNVLMYFSREVAAKVLDRLRLCLVDNGWLVVGACEAATAASPTLAAVNFPGAAIYRKEQGGEAGREGVTYPSSPQFPAPPLREARSPRCPAPSPPAEAPASLYAEAVALYGEGAYGEAALKAEACLSLNHADTSAVVLLCRIRANEGRLDEALQLSEQAIGSDKLNADLHYLNAVILMERGETDLAAQSLRRALYLNRDLVLAHVALGNLAQRQGKGAESSRHFGNALQILDRYRPEELLPESEGMPAGRLSEIIRAMGSGA